MQRKIALALILIFSTQIIFGQQQGKSGDEEFAKEVDIQAEYPGGLPALYAYFQMHLKYPVDARRKGIEGKTFIEFIVDDTGTQTYTYRETEKQRHNDRGKQRGTAEASGKSATTRNRC